jgi:O-antigen/teichoic acid export membrane protein
VPPSDPDAESSSLSPLRQRLFALTVPVRHLGGFSASIVLSSVIGVFSIPLLVASLGQAEWGKIAVIQTVGQLAAIVVAYGWGATGPSMVAAATPPERWSLYRQSLRVRTRLYLVVVPVTAGVLFFLLHGDALLAALGAAAYLLPALGAGWFFTGAAQPLRLFLIDALPTALGAIGGVLLATIFGMAWVVPVAQFGGSALAVVIARIVILRGSTAPARHPSIRSSLVEQRHAVTTAATSGFYVALPVVAVSLFFPAASPTYVLADRLFRYASLAFLPFQQYFQGWVPSDPALLARRARLSTVAATSIGVLGGLCIALLSPWGSRVLSGGEIEVSLSVSIPLGLAFIGVATSAVAGYASLVALGRTRTLARSTVIGACVGAPLVVVGALAHSLTGVALAVAATEVIVASYQVFVLLRVLRTARA